jgi:hypothetical protein
MEREVCMKGKGRGSSCHRAEVWEPGDQGSFLPQRPETPEIDNLSPATQEALLLLAQLDLGFRVTSIIPHLHY